MFNLHDLYATDVVPIRYNSNPVHPFVIRFAPQVVTEICFTARLENSLMRIHVKVKIKLEYASLYFIVGLCGYQNK